MNASKTIIIPDLHGREFWRRAVMNLREDTRVVFLGDYMDPYEDDWIYWSDAFKSLQDILAFKKTHPDQVTLLFGNHDLHYLYPVLKGSRYNEYQERRMRKFFTDNLDAFQMAYEQRSAGRHYLFTHAGVNRRWLEKHRCLFGNAGEINAETFNQLMFTEEFINALSDVSPWRCGKAVAGSMIWADVCEFEYESAMLPHVIQIFGHSRQSDVPRVIDGKVYCLDCQCAFYFNEDGVINKYINESDGNQI